MGYRLTQEILLENWINSKKETLCLLVIYWLFFKKRTKMVKINWSFTVCVIQYERNVTWRKMGNFWLWVVVEYDLKIEKIQVRVWLLEIWWSLKFEKIKAALAKIKIASQNLTTKNEKFWLKKMDIWKWVKNLVFFLERVKYDYEMRNFDLKMRNVRVRWKFKF